MTSKDLVERYRRIFNNPNMDEETVCKLIDELAMKSYFRGDFNRYLWP